MTKSIDEQKQHTSLAPQAIELTPYIFYLSKDQLEKTKKVFNAMDADNSGYIEVRELGQVAKMLEKMGIVINKENLEKVLNKFDTKKNKKLNLEQFRYVSILSLAKVYAHLAKCLCIFWI